MCCSSLPQSWLISGSVLVPACLEAHLLDRVAGRIFMPFRDSNEYAPLARCMLASIDRCTLSPG